MSNWPGDLGARWRDIRSRRDQTQEALNAVRGISAGKTKAEVRELLASEMRARGITPPPEPILDHMADQVLSSGDLPSQLRLAARGLGALTDLGARTARDIKDQFQGMGPNLQVDREPLLVRCDRARPAAEVVLDENAQQWLTPPGDPSAAPEFSEIFVLLNPVTREDGEAQIAVQAGDHQIGTLTTPDSADFADLMETGRKNNQPLAGEAIRDRAPDGTWHLRVYRPVPSESP